MMSGYNIRIKSMFGTNHSWSVVMRSLCLEFAKSNQRPSDMPSVPSRTYKDKGWISWPDWLGY